MPAASPTGSDELAQALLAALVAGKTFDLPAVEIDKTIFAQPDASGPLFEDVPSVKLEDLQLGINGLMKTLTDLIVVERREGRITGNEYSKTYLGMIQAALSAGVQFALGKDAAHWQARMLQQQAQTAQIEKVKARVELEVARLAYQRARYEALTMEVNYALTKLKLATEDVTYANLGKQGLILDLQREGLVLDNFAKTFTNAQVLPIQKDLLTEQANGARAQTADTRFDGTEVFGSVGKQKALYSQQIESYKRDAETKIGKMLADAWTVQKTQDEGLLPPTGFTNAALDRFFNQIKTNVMMPT
jgi:hypothetical protein